MPLPRPLPILIQNWAVVSTQGEQGDGKAHFSLPAAEKLAIHGRVLNHPRIKIGAGDGKQIITSRIRKVKGHQITTISGTTYELGNVNPDYVEWLEQNGITFNESNPIKLEQK